MEKSYRCSGACVHLYGLLIQRVQMLQDSSVLMHDTLLINKILSGALLSSVFCGEDVAAFSFKPCY